MRKVLPWLFGLGVVIVLLGGGSCGGDDDGGGTDGAARDGASGDGASGSDGPSGDGAAASSCPDDPPAGGSACTVPDLQCAWLRCATDDSYVQATCNGTTYAVTDEACEPFACSGGGGGGGGDTCDADQVCLEMAGGAFIASCAENPCGEGPITAECACAGLSCAGGCTVSGRTIQCNTCPPGPPCP